MTMSFLQKMPGQLSVATGSVTVIFLYKSIGIRSVVKKWYRCITRLASEIMLVVTIIIIFLQQICIHQVLNPLIVKVFKGYNYLLWRYCHVYQIRKVYAATNLTLMTNNDLFNHLFITFVCCLIVQQEDCVSA